jgi:hypothetical protein
MRRPRPPAAARAAANFPDRITAPRRLAPRGIATGRGTTFYAGSRRDGAIYRGDLRTGAGAVLVPGTPGDVAVGLEYDQRRDRLWVAGGATGTVSVYDASTGARLARYQLAAPGGAFLNDLVVTREAVYVTDSNDDVLYRIPLGPAGALGDAAPRRRCRSAASGGRCRASTPTASRRRPTGGRSSSSTRRRASSTGSTRRPAWPTRWTSAARR